MARRRRQRRNPFSDTLFQVVVGVITAVVASIAIDRIREVREFRALPQRDPQGYDVT